MKTSSAKSKEFFTINSLVASGGKIAFKYLAIEKVGLFILQKCVNHLLLAEINNENKKLKVLFNELSSVKSNLLRILNFLDFNHVCNIISSNNEKSILNRKYTHKKKLSDLIPDYKVNLTRSSHVFNKVILNFSSYMLTEKEKRLLCKGLRFCIPLKNIECADFLKQFELLYRDTLMFEMKLILLINITKSSLANCMSLNRLYQQYLKRNC